VNHGKETCVKIINHEGKCASIEGDWMISWHDEDPTPPDPHARDKFMAYVRGWSDGAGIRAMHDEFTKHVLLAESYNEGYTDGKKARGDVHVSAANRFGVKLSVLRAPGKIGETMSESRTKEIGVLPREDGDPTDVVGSVVLFDQDTTHVTRDECIRLSSELLHLVNGKISAGTLLVVAPEGSCEEERNKIANNLSELHDGPVLVFAHNWRTMTEEDVAHLRNILNKSDKTMLDLLDTH